MPEIDYSLYMQVALVHDNERRRTLFSSARFCDQEEKYNIITYKIVVNNSLPTHSSAMYIEI